jgi:alpha-1,2-mannosyltransferase
MRKAGWNNDMKANMREAKGERTGLYFKLALAVWLTALLVISVMVFLSPSAHSVTPVYHDAVQHWLDRDPLYIQRNFHYFPQFVLFFMPFHFMKVPYGDILYRISAVVFLAWGLWRSINLVRLPIGKDLSFLCATLVSLGPSLGAIRNGQANLAVAAIAVNAVVCLARSQWWRASLLLVGGVFIKPIGLVILFFSMLVYRPVIWRSALVIPPALTLPFLFAEYSYVISQYREFISHLFTISATTKYGFADVNGLLRSLGIGLSAAASQISRAAAGLVTAVVLMTGSKRIHGPARACLLLGLSTAYLVLFNPMTEGNSYVIVAPGIALYAVIFFGVKRFSILGWWLVFTSFSIYPLPEILRELDEDFGLWSRPLLLLIFYVLLASIIFTKTFDSLIVDSKESEQVSL